MFACANTNEWEARDWKAGRAIPEETTAVPVISGACMMLPAEDYWALARYGQLEVLEVFTQWEPQNYPDGSDIWQDSVLVCRKPTFSPWAALKNRIKRSLQLYGVRIG